MIEAFAHIIAASVFSQFPALAFAVMIVWLASRESERTHRFLSGFKTGFVYFCIPWVSIYVFAVVAKSWWFGTGFSGVVLLPTPINAMFLAWFVLGLVFAALGAAIGQRKTSQI